MRPEHWVYTIPLRLRSLFRRTQADQELDEEMSDHVELRTEEYVSKGLAVEEARRQALLEIGGVEKRKEECRDARHVTWIQELAQDLPYGLRMLRKSTGFHRCCRPDACSRHRRQHRHFLHREWRPSQPPAFSSSAGIDRPLRAHHQLRKVLHLLSQFSRLAAHQFYLCFHGCLSPRGFQHYRQRRAGARARRNGLGRVFPHPRCGAITGPPLRPRRGSPGRCSSRAPG
jgi:hypothetical protein